METKSEKESKSKKRKAPRSLVIIYVSIRLFHGHGEVPREMDINSVMSLYKILIVE